MGHGQRPAAERRLAGTAGPGCLTAARAKQARGGSTSSTSRSRAGLRLHPEVRHGALRRRWCEWEQPHNLSWHSAPRMMPNRCLGRPVLCLAPVLTGGSSWISDRLAIPVRSAGCPHRDRWGGGGVFVCRHVGAAATVGVSVPRLLLVVVWRSKSCVAEIEAVSSKCGCF